MQGKVMITTHAGGSMLAIPQTSENPVKAMQYINLMHTDTELLDMMLYGVQGRAVGVRRGWPRRAARPVLVRRARRRLDHG
mgnify:CR=1 FL=1